METILFSIESGSGFEYMEILFLVTVLTFT